MFTSMSKSLLLGSLFMLGSCIAVDNSFNGDAIRYPNDAGDDEEPPSDQRSVGIAVLRRYSCFNCHAGSQFPNFSSSTSDAGFVSSGLFNLDDPENSELLKAIRTTDCADSGGDCDMPAAPYTAVVSDEDYQALIDWVRSIEP